MTGEAPVHTANRVLWIVVAVVLIGLGILGVLAHYGRLPGTNPDLPLLSPDVRQWWQDWQSWALAGVIVGGLVVAVVGLLLIRSQLRRRGRADMPDFDLPAERTALAANEPTWPTNAPRPATTHNPPEVRPAFMVPGRLRVDASSLRHALIADLRAQRGVERADVRLTGNTDEPHLRVWLTVDPGADPADLYRRVAAAVDRFEVTAGRHARVEDVTIQLATHSPARVR